SHPRPGWPRYAISCARAGASRRRKACACSIARIHAIRCRRTCATCSSERGAPRRYTCAMGITTTLAAEASLQQEIRKSRFLARAAPVESAEDAAAFVVRVGERDATHNCWAWRIGAGYRLHDDGEPGGRDGRQIVAPTDHDGQA